LAGSTSKATAPIPSRDAPGNPWFGRLPSYCRSLLKIRVPVTVTLATTQLPVKDIVELVPGSILQFEKMCDEALSLEVGGQRVAEGETVKVGDKFGLRITSIVLPAERFVVVTGKEPEPDHAGGGSTSQHSDSGAKRSAAAAPAS
jgi:flagellar motor switch protein FliN